MGQFHFFAQTTPQLKMVVPATTLSVRDGSGVLLAEVIVLVPVVPKGLPVTDIKVAVEPLLNTIEPASVANILLGLPELNVMLPPEATSPF